MQSSPAHLSLKPSPLATYLMAAAGTAACLAAPQAEAAITAVTFGFGSSLTASDNTQYFDVAGSGGSYGGLLGTASSTYIGLGIGTATEGVYHNQSLSVDTGLMSFFANGTIIGGGGNGGFGGAYLQSSNPLLNMPTNQLNQNIGFRTDNGNWGWANVSWDATAKELTVNSAYVESVAGTSIAVGDTGVSAAPEPSRTLLALAGIAGVALRRRRKQVA